jgi:cysteinyl-tRNA synthetase
MKGQNMRLYNTLARKVEDFQPLKDNTVRIYSCGPTVYDHIHIGNLSAFIAADILRRTLQTVGYEVRHVMNFTDVDDKTIRRSQERYPDAAPEVALQQLTHEYEQIFIDDMQAIGNAVSMLTFGRATEHIADMQTLIRNLYQAGIAYIADDGIYFSIEAYRATGKTYGQLLELSTENTGSARIDNDEYDKASVHDFALWKTRKGTEPAWEFELDNHQLLGRPGWHIECSAMSVDALGQPFDIHTGGVDLIFPHHENEIAQSTAAGNERYAQFFIHNEHLLVDGKKMSKSLNNFFTLRDIAERGFDTLAFRVMVLQAHYRSQTNFTWENLEAAQSRLAAYRAMAVRRFQPEQNGAITPDELKQARQAIQEAMADDLNTPQALARLSALESAIDNGGITPDCQEAFGELLEWLDNLLGLDLAAQPDITDAQRQLIVQRQTARDNQDWRASDELRDQLVATGIAVRDTPDGPVWHWITR